MKFKKLISCLAAAAMLTSLVPAAFAADTAGDETPSALTINTSGTNNFEIEGFYSEAATMWETKTTEGTSYKYRASDDNASGGEYLSVGWLVGTSYTRKIDVKKAGEYKIDFVSHATRNNLSTLYLYVDDAPALSNKVATTIENTKTAIKDPFCPNYSGDPYDKLYKFSCTIYLSEGEHSVKLSLPNGQGVNRAAFAIDNISFTNVTKTLTAGAQQKSYEFEEVWAYPGRVKDDTNASGGKFVNQTYEDYLPKKDYAKLNVEKDGFYKVNFVAEPSGEYLSRTTITVDGEGVVQNSINYESAAESTTEVIGPGEKALKNYYGYIYLTKGEHELTVEYELSVKSKTRHAYGFDKFSFTEVAPATLSENGGKIEAEGNFGGKLYNGNLTANTNASGGNLLYRPYTPSSVKETVEAYVNVEKAGFYSVDLYSNKYSDYVSAVTMKLDGGAVLESSKTNPGTQVSAEAYPNADFTITKHTANTPVYLTAGVHKIELDFKACVSGSPKVVKYSLDYVEFKPYESDMTFTSDLAEIAEYPFSVGDDSYPITVKCNGAEITNGSYQITYKSSNEAVVKVNEDGEITPMKAGYSDVSVTVGISGVTMATFNERIYVLDDDNQKYISNVSYANGTVSFVATDNSDEDLGGFAGTAYVAVYNGDALVNVKIVNLNADNTEYTANIEIKSGETAKILVWDDNFAPIWVATDVK